jgi:Protein of unknown function (DUF4197)
MDRRRFHQHTLAAGFAWLVSGALQHAHALSLASLSEQEVGKGLKAALEQGAKAAVSLLGQPGGFLDNPKVRIPLPDYLEKAADVLRMTGQGKKVDELVTGMNRAAEAAVPMGRDLLVKAVQNMSVQDAKQILREPLGASFLPVVGKAVSQVKLAKAYNRVASQASGFGLVKKEEASVEQYVTGKTLDGLYTIIGEEERKIRQDPVGAGSKLIEKVFGAVK